MSSNPVFNRLAAHSKPPSLRMTFLTGIGLFVAAIFGAALWIAATPGQLIEAEGAASFQAGPGTSAIQYDRAYKAVFGPADLVSTTIDLLLAILIMAVLVSASILTAQEARSEAYVLQRLTGLLPGPIVDGMLGAALFRWRVPLALAVAAIPLLVVSPYQHDQGTTRYNCVHLVPDYDELDLSQLPPCADPHDPRLWWRSMNVISGAVALVGGVLLAAALGVSLTLAWPHKRTGVVAIVAGLLVVPVALVLILTLLGPTIDNIYLPCLMCLSCTCHVVWVWSPTTAALPWLLAMIPYALAWGAARLARRWA